MTCGTPVPASDPPLRHPRQGHHHALTASLLPPHSLPPATATPSSSSSPSLSSSASLSSSSSSLTTNHQPLYPMLPVNVPPPGLVGHRNATRGAWRIDVSATLPQDVSHAGQSSYSSPPSHHPSPPLTPPDSSKRAAREDLSKLLFSQQQLPSSQLLKDLITPISPHSSLPTISSAPASSPSSSSSSSPGPLPAATLKSRNDIFASTPLTPPKAPPSSVAMSRLSAPNDPSLPSASPVHSTRNSLFFDTPTSSPSFAVRRRGEWPANQDSAHGGRAGHMESGTCPPHADVFSPETADDLTRRPSLGRSSTAERERERCRIRQSKEIDFRLAPSREYLLGEGRHCDVFLGAYRRRHTSSRHANPASEWQLCAVKRLHPDRQSQLLGLDEAFALRRLGPHSGIVKLIDIRDEVLAGTSSLPPPKLRQVQFDASVPNGSTTADDEQVFLSHSPLFQSGRSSSDPWIDTKGQAPAHPRRGSELHEDQETTPRMWISNSQDGTESPDDDSEEDAPKPTPALQGPRQRFLTEQPLDHLPPPASTASSDPPRLLILLELLPLNLATYSQRHSSRISIFFWLQCACELASTLEWMHDRGCVHCDIKPENILLDHTLRTKLCDFNSAFFPNASTTPLTDGRGLGTPAYGAPELTKRGKSGDVVSFAVDIFSLGALLYSLATGVEPMARAKSMIEMLHRKERFFLTEENDRIARTSVAEGWADSGSNAGSANHSRHSSLRRSHKDATGMTRSVLTQRPSRKRDSSADSLVSTASSINTMSGKTPSLAAIQLLLEPSSLAGLLVPPTTHRRPTGTGDAHETQHHRALSLHKDYASNRAAPKHQAVEASGPYAADDIVSDDSMEIATNMAFALSRPSVLRRTISYGGAVENGESITSQVNRDLRNDDSSDLALAVCASFAEVSREKYRLEEEESFRCATSALRMGAKAFKPLQPCHGRNSSLEVPCTSQKQKQAALSHHSKSASNPSHSRLNSSDGEDEERSQQGEEDRSPYRDGSPALLLSGGGKLPQAALDLLEQMLLANPLERPKASEVKRRLEAIREETLRALD